MPYFSVLDQIRSKVLNKVPGIEITAAIYCTQRHFDMIVLQRFDAVRTANPNRSEAYMQYLGEFNRRSKKYNFPGINPEPFHQTPPTQVGSSTAAERLIPIARAPQNPVTPFGSPSTARPNPPVPQALPGKSSFMTPNPQSSANQIGMPPTVKIIGQAPPTPSSDLRSLSLLAQATQTPTNFVKSLEKSSAVSCAKSTTTPLPNQVTAQGLPAVANKASINPNKEREIEELRYKCTKNAKALAHIYEAAGIAPHGLSRKSAVELGEWLDENYDALPAILHQLYQSRASGVAMKGSSKRNSHQGDGENPAKRLKMT